MDVIRWLLGDDTPGVALLTRRLLLDEDPNTRKMKSLRKRCNEYPPAARMIKRTSDAIAAGDYKKYTGAYWTLIILAELHADGRDKQIRKLAEHVLSTQLANGGFSATGQPSLEFNCLSANVLRSLVHFGYAEDDRIQQGYRRLMALILAHRGVPCVILNQVLLTSCIMTIPQTLRCLAIAPHNISKRDLKKTRDILVKQLLAVRVYRYVRPDAKAFHAAVPNRPKGMLVREFKSRWLAKHKARNRELVAKPGWLRFGFPHTYNPDMLEAMLALTESRVKHSRRLDDSLDYIERKQDEVGRWNLEVSLNGKMLADIERKGKPSKWITLRAMQVLKHFGRLEV